MAAGTVTITEVGYRPTKKIVFAWTAGTVAEAGTASGTTTADFWGECVGLTTIPGTGGDAPDDNYNVTITDVHGHDVLLGAGLLRDTANTEHVTRASLACCAGSLLTINVTAAGSANKGTAILYLGS
jgi:hypothetical protein